MDTMKAFWRYDWARNRRRLITVAVLAALWPWGMAAAQAGVRSGAPWAHVILTISVVGFFAIPFVLLDYVGELGRNGGPLDYRHLGRSLPLESGRWAAAKIVSALSWGVLMPTILILSMIAVIVHVIDEPGSAVQQDWGRQGASGLVLIGVLSAGSLWLMLCTAVIPHGLGRGIGMLIGVAAFVCGEGIVRVVVSLRLMQNAMKRIRDPWESASEAGLCLLLAAVLALVFIRYHKNRRPWQAAGLALVALAVVDGARAWLWR